MTWVARPDWSEWIGGDGALALCQGLNFAPAMLLFGLHAFLVGFASPRLAIDLNSRLRRAEVASLALIIATAALWPFLLAVRMTGDDPPAPFGETLRSLVFETDFGHVWLAHAALLVILGLVTAGAQPLVRRAVLSTLVLGSLGFVGHATMPGGVLGWFHRACQALHLLSAGAWIGGLVPLVATLRLPRTSDLGFDAAAALKRFSVGGHAIVALVIATGVVNAALIVGVSPPALDTPYIRVLLAKIAVVAAMVGVALFNRYRLVPRLRHDRAATLKRLDRLSILNIALGGMALGLASLVGTLDPAS